MNSAEQKRNERLSRMPELDLLRLVCADEGLTDYERNAFDDMTAHVKDGGRLSYRQRAWLEEVAQRVVPLDSREVPRGAPVETPDVLRVLPKRPPGRI